MKRDRLLPIAAALLLAFTLSCSGIQTFQDIEPEHTDAVRIPLKLSCELWDFEDEAPESRSSHSNSALTAISNANYYLFSQDGSLLEQMYFDSKDDFFVNIPDMAKLYTLYIVANIGRFTIPDSTTESGMSGIRFDYLSESNYKTTIDNFGFPMSAVINDFGLGGSLDLKLKRLVHQLRVKVDVSSLTSATMDFTAATIRNAPLDICPFAAASKATKVCDADFASESDLSALSSGQEIKLYMLENMRGDLNPSISGWEVKTPEKISVLERGLASYLELVCDARTPTASYIENKYRAYIGTDCTNFDAQRGCYTILDNKYVNNFIMDDGWRIDDGIISDREILEFVDTRYTRDNAPNRTASLTDDVSDREYNTVENFYLIKGFTAIYYIYRSNENIEYWLDYPSDKLLVHSCPVPDDKRFIALMIAVKDNPSGPAVNEDPEFGTNSCTIGIRSVDGVLEDELNVEVVNRPLELRFAYEEVQSSVAPNPSRLNMYFCNPLKLAMEVEVTGRIKGTVVYRKNSVSEEQSANLEYAFSSGAKYDPAISKATLRPVVPVSGVACPVDLYSLSGTTVSTEDLSTVHALGEWGGFSEFFYALQESSFAYSGLNCFQRTIAPTELSLDISVKCCSPNEQRLRPRDGDNKVCLPVRIANSERSSAGDSGGWIGGGTDVGFNVEIMFNALDGHQASIQKFDFISSTANPFVLADGSIDYNSPPIELTINGVSSWNMMSSSLIPNKTFYNESWNDSQGITALQ